MSEAFVPVALNTDRLPDTASGRFFRELMKQWPQGLWVVTPEGKVLAHHYHRAKPGEAYQAGQDRWVRETIAMIEAAGPQPKRDFQKIDPFPDRGVGTAPDGGVRLAVSVVGLRNGRREGPPAVDSARLSKEEWAKFVPAPGEFAAPAFAPALSPLTDSIFVPKPADVKSSSVTATVLRADADVIVVGYQGKWASAHDRDGDPKFPIRADAAGGGVGVFDAKTRQPTRVVFLLRGTYDHGTRQQTAGVVEWRAVK